MIGCVDLVEVRGRVLARRVVAAADVAALGAAAQVHPVPAESARHSTQPLPLGATSAMWSRWVQVAGTGPVFQVRQARTSRGRSGRNRAESGCCHRSQWRTRRTCLSAHPSPPPRGAFGRRRDSPSPRTSGETGAYDDARLGDVAQLARAPALQAGGRGFESHRLHRPRRKTADHAAGRVGGDEVLPLLCWIARAALPPEGPETKVDLPVHEEHPAGGRRRRVGARRAERPGRSRDRHLRRSQSLVRVCTTSWWAPGTGACFTSSSFMAIQATGSDVDHRRRRAGRAPRQRSRVCAVHAFDPHRDGDARGGVLSARFSPAIRIERGDGRVHQRGRRQHHPRSARQLHGLRGVGRQPDRSHVQHPHSPRAPRSADDRGRDRHDRADPRPRTLQDRSARTRRRRRRHVRGRRAPRMDACRDPERSRRDSPLVATSTSAQTHADTGALAPCTLAHLRRTGARGQHLGQLLEPRRQHARRIARLRRPRNRERRVRCVPGNARRRVGVGVGSQQGSRRKVSSVARDRKHRDGGHDPRLRRSRRRDRHARARRLVDADRIPHDQTRRSAIRLEDRERAKGRTGPPRSRSPWSSRCSSR